ncbi:hypothetical protein CKF54_07275 [Psittacicella hinzii]|uniref:HTH lysR-type domain-containing protein n=1 Tax=Psittacicella hinzii TaxID=2028575 RepID=A0A3A1Y1N5_9GAMM|nr:LysR family transcriptional regulator [Psittacicella hinzii]RIY31196.1 hypothetical protein CKF54_07275 [Psittacicella hinzii]
MQKLDELRTITSFLKAAECGSFTQAADVLGLTPAAISKNVSTLEKSLGVKLFNRTTRSLSLTNEGQAYAEQAGKALSLLEEANESLRQLYNEPYGRVKISAPNTIGRIFLIPLLPLLKAQFPQITIDLDLNDRNVDLVKDNFDLVIHGGTINSSSLIARKIGSLALCVVATPTYLQQNGTPATPQELEQHQLLTRALSTGKLMPWSFVDNAGDSYSLSLDNPAYVLTDVAALLELTLAHQGIAQLPYYLVHEHLEAGTLVQLFADEHQEGEYELFMQYPHRQFIAPRVRAVIDFFHNQLKDNPSLNYKK